MFDSGCSRFTKEANHACVSLAGAAVGTGTTLTLLKLMTMTKLKAGIVSAIVVAGVSTSLLIQHQAQIKLREENQSLRLQVDQLNQLIAENERLSNLVARANISQSLSKNQFSELLRLRGELGVLRNRNRELERLRDENRRLRSAQGSSQEPQVAESPPEVPPQDIFPKESWAFAGFATPEAALQSFHWATIKGDIKTLAACHSSPEDQIRTGKDMEKMFEGKSDSEIATFVNNRMGDITAYRIIERTNSPDGQVGLAYYYDGRKIVRAITFEKVGSEWKIAPGQN